jgi:phosphoglucomutase
LRDVARIPFERARRAATNHPFDYRRAYVEALDSVVELDLLRGSALDIGVDPLGGASVDYWESIGDRYGFALEVVNREVDPTFRFMTADWDGALRMDPSSVHAMTRLIGLRDRFDLAFATDPDADRHGIVTRGAGLMNANHYLAVAIDYLFRHRPYWRADAAIGKTIVSSSLIDRVAAQLGRRLHEVPVGFKWFVDGLLDGSLGFAGEESAGASFLRRDGRVWTTDKDGILLGLLAAEITARTGRDPGERYRALTQQLGEPVYARIDAPATPEEKAALAQLTASQLDVGTLAGDPITSVLTATPEAQPIGGIKVVTAHGWFAARPSGTESVYKLYAESFDGAEHLRQVQDEAQVIVGKALKMRARGSGR